MKKILFIILDGLGDEPIPALQDQTPLEAAKTPNLDFLARNGICGLAVPEFQGIAPTSEESHFSLFGYNPRTYKIRRGIITATGCGMWAKKGDVGLRGNFATVDEKLNIIDRRAGRIKNAESLIRALREIEINRIKFFLKSATGHRIGIIMRGRGLDPDVSDGDPGKLGKKVSKIKPLEKSKEAAFTTQILNRFLEKAHQILKEHPRNRQREKKGLLPANYILVRGGSFLPQLPSFKKKYGLKACCIAGKFLYKQIAEILGMDLIKVRGATGKPDTNLKRKFKTAKRKLKNYDFIFLHIKATDLLAEDGNFLEKKEFIERIDWNMHELRDLENVLVIITCDHSTCSLLKRHCKNPCPILIYGAGKDEVAQFSEKSCKKGKLGKFKQITLMKKILKLASV